MLTGGLWMFGYIIANMADLSHEEKNRYRQVYCGLCRELGRRHGQLSRICLNYDMTFLVLMLGSLYEPEEGADAAHCIMHPFKKKEYSISKFTEYAADMTVALTYYKCKDDWKDERKITRFCYAGILKRAYADVRKKYSRQCDVIEGCMKKLVNIEREAGGMDLSAGCFGELMAEIFAYREDVWSKPLRQFGNYLGRFIYLMDAVIDYEDDIKSGNYNPIAVEGKTKKETEEIMTIYIGAASEIFEKLPLVEDVQLLRNIIYAGVWQKYRANETAEVKGE